MQFFGFFLICINMYYPQGPVQDQRREIAAVIQRCYKRYKQVGAAQHKKG